MPPLYIVTVVVVVVVVVVDGDFDSFFSAQSVCIMFITISMHANADAITTWHYSTQCFTYPLSFLIVITFSPTNRLCVRYIPFYFYTEWCVTLLILHPHRFDSEPRESLMRRNLNDSY